MRKLLLVPLLAVIAAAGWLLTSGGGGVGHAGDLAAPTLERPQILVCYSLHGGNDPNVRVDLVTDNFGQDTVRVRRSTLMCEAGQKFRLDSAGNLTDATGTADGRVLQCFGLLRGADPDDPVTLITENFGPDRVDVRRATSMCEIARIHRVTDSFAPDHVLDHRGPVLECYRLRGGDDPHARVVLNTRNFERDEVVVRQAIAMCEEAKKIRPASAAHPGGETGSPTGYVWECFSLEEGDSPGAKVVLQTRNFGEDEVRVGRAILMCEAAKKLRLDSLPVPG